MGGGVNNNSYWTAEHLEFMKLRRGDEIEFEGRLWFIASFENVAGTQRAADTIMYSKVCVVSADDERIEREFKLYPKWRVSELNTDRPPVEFSYKLVEKGAWDRVCVWVRKEAI